MEAKHTPEPWEWNKYGADDATVSKMREVGIKPTLSLTNEGSTVVNSMNGPFACLRCDNVKNKDKWETEDPERDANARLIAVAPDLLKASAYALEMIQKAFDIMDGGITADNWANAETGLNNVKGDLQDVIAKATA